MLDLQLVRSSAATVDKLLDLLDADDGLHGYLLNVLHLKLCEFRNLEFGKSGTWTFGNLENWNTITSHTDKAN